MRCLTISIAAAWMIALLDCPAVLAQTNTPTPAASPLGGNVPLGSTELTPNGLSPPVTAACPHFTGTLSGSTTSPTFDGGGLTSTPDCAAGAAPGAAASASSASNSVTTGLASISGHASIPLGATELGTPGESLPLGLSAPATSTTPCAGVSGAQTMTLLPGISSPNGC
jgi:hypothetical protein